jgi:hypothetical protein
MKNTNKKPVCKLTGQNGNIFNLVGIAARALKEAGQDDKAKELKEKLFTCANYEAALNLIADYVEVK